MAHLMHRELAARCVQCPSAPPSCSCTSQDQCVFIALSCDACPSYQCVAPTSDSKSGSSGVSGGAVAGAVIASLIFLVLVLGAFWFYRRRLRQRQAAEGGVEGKSDSPARAEDVLNRPDPNEKPDEPEPAALVRIYTGSSVGTINLDPASQGASTTRANDGHERQSTRSNPFNDSHSIQTTSTGTRSNVIPIALVPPATFVPPQAVQESEAGDHSTVATDGSTGSSSRLAPPRPERDPSLDIGVKGIEVSHDAAARPYDAQSQHTGLSNRASYLSTGSFASDLLTEAPVIVRPTRVVGVVKAEVIRTSPSKDSLRPPPASNRPPVRSPLAATSFGPTDVLREVPEGQEVGTQGNPFGDEHSPYNSGQGSPSPSQTTFGSPSMQDDSQGNRLSTYTQAASVIGSVIGAEIGGATRVHLGFDHLRANPPSTGEPMPHTASSGVLNSPRGVYRMTSAKLVNTSPSGSTGPTGTLERQQHQAMQQMDVPNKRVSMTSMADSILEGFPFVPPSPISNRPIRTPPRSPLAQQSFANANNARDASPSPAPSSSLRSPPPRDPPARESLSATETSLSPPPRKARALSVASQSSTMTNGLSSFPFQIDAGASDNASAGSAPSSFVGRTRASLDTLALTSDLSSYPLNFDRSTPPPVPRR
ncbi:uncharacterized protein B0H18DRAFT_1094516 [Fomitopsis serialis]|uniref:uncharacterized protein n=1 Tax=Fomitopsis serialis TaxID=139415 RepID=UPI002008DA8E|nr:uncharacterized protein B0H18DRAFT_1094516 [Neoantrodia serialis]KAH9927326.1 hypothetical protein B0H18DRAFT_1094516 [Neoantrodia serialis]